MVLDEHGIYALTSPVIVSGRRVGFVRVGITGMRHDEHVRTVTTSGAFVLLAVLLLGFVFSQIIAVSITRPISRLSAAAEELSKQNWQTPIPV